ncbi:S41 family peptidase [Fodinibius halophilus]|uniref:S41 family peptidase n=1 Tax=Fodinibius halophilus TaxID=1736908 RepID=A0A6M1T7H2_9BACT|nr:S41 family peptidase [Fodinibius halophilus]NGP89325.1 S41 family peptidase [Fodinibius halophilus]
MGKWKKIVAGSVLAITSLAVMGLVRNPDIYFLIKKNFTIFSEVYREVSLHYVDEVNPEQLMRKGIDAMLESLDPYTVLIDEADNQSMEIMTRGSYGGVGMDVGYRGDDIVVIAPLEGYSAHSKGIRTGDVITAVDGVPVNSLSPEEVRSLTTGEPGTTVTMTVQRYGIDDPLKFELTRQRVEVKNVPYVGFVGEQKKVGYILLSRFSQNAAGEVQEAIEHLQAQKELQGLVLDLRNNPGGLLDQAVGLVDKFVPQGRTVVETRGRLRQHNNSFKTKETPLLPDLSVVILQNGGSASASEIVAGAMQDLDRAVIMGEQSFGKGLVQVVRPLSYNTSLKLTTSRYYIPSGRSIQSVTYTHDQNNSVVNKPDSTRRKFRTKSGRPVFDGDGISPDIQISDKKPSLLQTSLMQQNMIFKFANKYAANHDSLEHKMGADTLFEKFQRYIEDQEFEYETPSEKYLAKIDSALQIAEDEKKHLTALGNKIESNKTQAFYNQRDVIDQLLYQELIARYKGKKGQYSASLPYDRVVNEAVKVLMDSSRYNNILSVSN